MASSDSPSCKGRDVGKVRLPPGEAFANARSRFHTGREEEMDGWIDGQRKQKAE
jgi:hypothetical protein